MSVGNDGGENGNADIKLEEAGRRWHVERASSRILVEVATAWAITKVFLPARIVASVWATPWFARVVVGRIGGGVGRYFHRGVSQGNTFAAKGGSSNVMKGPLKPPKKGY